MKTSGHMNCVHVKYWLAYCISLSVQMIYTLSLAHATVSTATSHKYTHVSNASPENMPAGRTDSWLL
jgi:hypothetical protein